MSKEYDHPEHPDHMAMGGNAHCYAHGGDIHHHPDCYMAKGGKTPNFLEGLKKGALHRELGVPQSDKIPSGKIEKATHSDNETLRKRAQFAENAKHWNHKAEGGEVGYSEGGMAPHDDAAQDVDMIKSVLQKVIGDMEEFEAQRHLPEGHPAKHVEIKAEVHPEGSPAEEATETPDEEQGEENPKSLDEVMGQADQADADGSMPEDHEAELHPAIAALIREKKKKGLPQQ